MHEEILTKGQTKLLPLINRFNKNFILVGGTAIALHIGHRRSIDFDLFSDKPFKNSAIRRKILRTHKIELTYIKTSGEYTIRVNDIKMTFFEFPFVIKSVTTFGSIIKIPDLLTLAAMKAYALGSRGKWKDYVDLFFILRDHYSMQDIVQQGKKLFDTSFNERIFREALSYFDDVSYKEEIEYLPGFAVSDKKIKQALINYSLS